MKPRSTALTLALACARGVLWLLIACGAPALDAAAAPISAPGGSGFVDRVEYAGGSRELYLAGWAAPERPNVFTSNLIVRLGDREIYRGRLQRSERPDVVAATGRADWLWSGWQIRVALPRDVPAGTHAVGVRVRLTDGTQFDLPSAVAAQRVTIEQGTAPPLPARIAVALAVLLPLPFFVRPDRVAVFLPAPASAPARFGAAVAASFALLVASGISGSSLPLGLAASTVTTDDAAVWLGTPRQIRSDEWLVTTPMAIGQTTHRPAFPVVNRNAGPDGQNMLVVGMTGVPVSHISALARPATWGFFLFDLRRALAWYWWFPFFACFAAAWLFLARLLHLEWRAAAVLAATLSGSPYSVAFSGWPAYVAAFPLLAVLAAHGLLTQRRIGRALLLGAAAGLCVAGFALVLYPAWQVAIAYLLVPVALAVFVRDRRQFGAGAAQVAGALAALLVCAILLGAWWHAARDSIAAIGATVYPGQRSTMAGGDIDPWYLIKGLLSPLTMYRGSALLDESDAGSFVFLLPACAIGVLAASRVSRRVEPIVVAVLGFIGLALAFMFVGFGPAFARYSLWGHSVPFRLDIALGLAQTLLIAWLLSQAARGTRLAEIAWGKVLALAAAIASALHAALLFDRLPAEIAAAIPGAWSVLACAALGWAAYLLLTQRSFAFLALYASWTVGTALAFNPLVLQPTAITPAPALTGARDAPVSVGDARIAVIGTQDPAMTLLAAGLPVVNAVSYSPQESLWQRLDPSGSQRVLYNRYQRLMLVLAPMRDGADYRIDSPRLDEVRVRLDPARFDFRRLGASLVLTTERDAEALAANASLRRVSAGGGCVLHRVVQ